MELTWESWSLGSEMEKRSPEWCPWPRQGDIHPYLRAE